MTKPILWIRPKQTAKDEALLHALANRGLGLATMNGNETAARFYRPQDVSALIVDARLLDVACHFRDEFTGAPENHLPLLVVGRDNDLQTRLSALRHDADAFFAPPMDAEEIAAKLVQLLGIANGARPFKVVVVDDDSSQADFAAAILKKAGIEVRTVTESLKILDTLRSFMPDLILMDVYMPHASGVELTAIIRGQKELMDIPIVYLSGEQDPDKQLDALRAGGEDFLTKPIRPKHLVAAVRQRVDRSRQLRARITEGRRQEGDPAQVRKRILAQLETLRGSSAAAGKITGLLYVEIDNPLLLLGRVNLDGIDQVMSSVKRLCREVAVSEDRIARFGDFCLVLIAQREKEEQLHELALRIKGAVDPYHFSTEKALVNTTVSIGVLLLEDFEGNVSDLINDAINACHKARTDGKEGVLLQRSIQPTERKNADIRDDELLEWITDRANLQLVYQPIVPLQREHGALYQCLLQLRTADGQLMSAGEFLPTIEQTGQILKLDRWVIVKTLMTLSNLALEINELPTLMISQSASALKDLRRIPWLEEILAKTRINGRTLALEFPFPEVIADPQGAKDYLASLYQLGIGISLNCTRDLDALLQELSLLPAHYIKITEQQISSHPDSWGRLVKAAHKQDKQVIVSRLDNPELLGQLWLNKVDYIQGNFIQPPGNELNYDFTGTVLA